MGDSYDRVSERQSVEQSIKKARTLCDIDSFYSSTLSRDEDLFFPRCLHVLKPKGKSGLDDLENVWEGKVKEMRLAIENNSKKLTTTLKTELSSVNETILTSFQSLDKGMKDKFKKLDEKMKSLETQMEKLEETPADGGENEDQGAEVSPRE